MTSPVMDNQRFLAVHEGCQFRGHTRLWLRRLRPPQLPPRPRHVLRRHERELFRRPLVLWPTYPSACPPPNTPRSLDGYMLTVNVAQNLYVPLSHTAASLS